VEGPEIIVATLERAAVRDVYGNQWQYLSRSDHHSKVACWAILFDLLQASSQLREQAMAGHVVLGLNHEMREFRTNRKKRLDFVVATPAAAAARTKPARAFVELVDHYGLVLNSRQRALLADLAEVRSGVVGTVRMALEAKACMTAHIRAIPRLFDELQSSHTTVHGSADDAIAIGFVMVNTAREFISSDRNRRPAAMADAIVSRNDEHGPARVIEKMEELPRRRRPGEDGFDAFGLFAIHMRNDGSEVRLSNGHPVFAPGSVLSYEQMIRRAASLYDSRFR
jgi:hypothetical protein